ncbi:MAG: cell division protein FtsQ/DivIB [Alphaproteobacteria bacterium]|nr:cell division protein FtsQ/DivIB [Alphaproteobacteria bacterium]
MARVKKKPLRGSVRQNNADFEEETPRFGFSARLALMVLAAVTCILLVSWVWHSTWPRTLKNKTGDLALTLTQKAGFSVADRLVEGRRYTDRDALVLALNARLGSPIFAFDPEQARQNILALPWTENVTVLRSLPDKIVVKLTERVPMARWQHHGKTVVIDAQGKELVAANPQNFADLPLVVGMAAPEQTGALLTDLQTYPAIAKALKAAVRVGERRWNFYLQPNLLIRLPEQELDKALSKLTELVQEQKILERNIVAIDLRLPDRLIVEPGTQPAEPDYGEAQE